MIVLTNSESRQIDGGKSSAAKHADIIFAGIATAGAGFLALYNVGAISLICSGHPIIGLGLFAIEGKVGSDIIRAIGSSAHD